MHKCTNTHTMRTCVFFHTSPEARDGRLLTEEIQGTAPLVITCKESDLGPILARANMARAQGWSSMDTMLARRLCVYPFWVRLPVRPGEYVPECASCFAKMLLQHTS